MTLRERVAEALVDTLFTSGSGDQAHRLVLVRDRGLDGAARETALIRNLGGWGRAAVLDRVIGHGDLITIFKLQLENPADPIHRTDLDGHGREFSRLQHWGLIEQVDKGEEQKRGRTSGLWAITAKGTRFVLRQIRVPRHVYLYNNIRQGFSSDSTDIVEALDNHFDYDELMRSDGRMHPEKTLTKETGRP